MVFRKLFFSFLFFVLLFFFFLLIKLYFYIFQLQLKSFLEGFGKLLELNETFSRIALIGFDAKGIVYIGQFAESQTTYSANIGKVK